MATPQWSCIKCRQTNNTHIDLGCIQCDYYSLEDDLMPPLQDDMQPSLQYNQLEGKLQAEQKAPILSYSTRHYLGNLECTITANHGRLQPLFVDLSREDSIIMSNLIPFEAVSVLLRLGLPVEWITLEMLLYSQITIHLKFGNVQGERCLGCGEIHPNPVREDEFQNLGLRDRLPGTLTTASILAFLNGGGNKTKPPASKRLIAELPRLVYKLEESKHDATTCYNTTTCSICQDDFEKGENVTVLPCKCKNLFHMDCITPWLNRCNTCPSCRQEMEADVSK